MVRHHVSSLFILMFILLLAAAFRVINIDQQSLWVDEGYAFYHANQPDLIQSLSRDTHPPLYFATLRLWQTVAGETELALRFFSILPSMLSVALMFLLSKEWVRARGGNARQSSVPVLAVLLLALADPEIFLAQEVRHYTWHVLWAISSTWAFLRWLRLGQRRWLGLWIVFSAALLYTHYIGAFTIFVQGVYVLLFLRGRTRWIALGALAVVGLILAPWLIGVGTQQIGNRGANWSFEPSWGLLKDIRDKWFTRQWPLMMGLALLGTVTIHYLKTHWRIVWRPVAPVFLLLMWVIVPVVLMIVLNNVIPILSPRRISQITPPIALLIAFGLSNLRRVERGFLVAVILVYGVTNVDFYRPKPPWREVASQVAQYAEPGDLALTDISGGDYQMLYYYRQLLPEGVPFRSLKVWRDFEPATYTTEGPLLVQQYDTVWLMYWSTDGQIFPWLANAGLTRTATFAIDYWSTDLNVYRYDRLPEEPVTNYENGLTLCQVVLHPDALRVDLWWSSDETLTIDYTTSAFLLDETGQLVAQYDSFPLAGQHPTTTWKPDEVVYDPKPLELSAGDTLPPGRYQVGVQVYHWTPEGTQRVLTQSGEEWVIVGEWVR